MSAQNPKILDSINLSPLNTSKSKAMYSFSKANRFPQLKELNSSFYDHPTSFSKRATSFGFGTKSELVSKYQCNPSPDKYSKHSDFQKSPKKGLSIGLGRDKCKNISIFNMTKYPSPTDYDTKQNKQNSVAYSMRSKVKLPVLFPVTKTPGPGKYQSEHIDKNGFSFNSKFKTNVSYKIHEQSPKKIQKEQTPVLGPLTYNTVVPSTGKQFLSRNQTEKSFYFDKKPRETFQVNTISPGPAAYNAGFSEFNR